MMIPVGISGEVPPANFESKAEVIRAYEIYDPYYCMLTPRPFICKKCLLADERFVQILSMDSDGRPARRYACLPWKKKYLY